MVFNYHSKKTLQVRFPHLYFLGSGLNDDFLCFYRSGVVRKGCGHGNNGSGLFPKPSGQGNTNAGQVRNDAGQGQNDAGQGNHRYFLRNSVSGIGNIYGGQGNCSSGQVPKASGPGNNCGGLGQNVAERLMNKGLENNCDKIKVLKTCKEGY